MNTTRLFLVDDEPNVRQGLRMRLEMEPGFVVVGETGNGETAAAAARNAGADVVLMDIDMPGKDGIAVLAELTANSHAAVVMVSMHDDPATRARANAAGAAEFVGKHQIDVALIDAIRRAAAQARCREQGRRPE